MSDPADEAPKCSLCGEPMPPGEEMFEFHGYSGPCPKPPLPKPKTYVPDVGAAQHHLQRLFEACGDGSGKLDAGWVITVATKALEALSQGIKADAREDVPALIKEVRRLRAVLREIGYWKISHEEIIHSARRTLADAATTNDGTGPDKGGDVE